MSMNNESGPVVPTVWESGPQVSTRGGNSWEALADFQSFVYDKSVFESPSDGDESLHAHS